MLLSDQVLGIALWALKEFVAAHSPQLQGASETESLLQCCRREDLRRH